MTFISSIIALNVSIILMMIIAFSNITFVYQIQCLQLYQLVDLNDTDYETYSKRQMKQYEKKLNIHQFFGSVHNRYFIKFKLSGEKTWDDRKINVEESCKSYRYVDQAVPMYYLEKFKNKMEILTKCTQGESENILDIVYKGLNREHKKENTSSSLFSSCFIGASSSEDVINIEEQIKVIDKAIGYSSLINQFYRCFRDFKNELVNMKIEGANYPKKAIEEFTIDESKQLSKNNKKKILTLKDVDFLKKKKLNIEEKTIEHWLEVYTGYKVYPPTYSSGYNQCVNFHNNDHRAKGWTFKMTKLSYQYIYPSKSEDLSSYINKRQIIIKNLKLLDYRFHIDNRRKQRFITLEEKNSKVDQHYFDLMKKCRALSQEKEYEVYVMRLINSGCRPLGEPEWKTELKDAGKNNDVAELQE